jgi:hypothetical protein
MFDDTLLMSVANGNRDAEDLSADELEPIEEELTDAIEELDKQIEKMTHLKQALVAVVPTVDAVA